MQRVVISIEDPAHETCRDLEVPADVPSAQLAGMIAQALGCARPRQEVREDFRLATASGRQLRATESLAGLGLWDGSEFVLQRRAHGAGDHAACFLRSAGGVRYELTLARHRVGRRNVDQSPDDVPEDLLDLRDDPDGQTVSRNHALLECVDGAWLLTPLAAAENATRVNGQVVEAGRPCELLPGDWLQFGRARLQFGEQ